jgi:hypothetical protein
VIPEIRMSSPLCPVSTDADGLHTDFIQPASGDRMESLPPERVGLR